MPSNLKRFMKAVIVLLPLFFLGGLILKAEIDRNNGPIWTLKITGYDPRDLLRGHYVQFQFDWNWQGQQPDKCHDCCVCLSDAQGVINPEARIVSCEADKEDLPHCTSVIRTWQDRAVKNRFDNQGFRSNYRYYLPENDARALQQRLNRQQRPVTQSGERDEFTLDVNMTKDGRMIFHDLKINARPYHEVLQQ